MDNLFVTPHPPKTRILVVDDQPLIVEEMCEFLESNGFTCIPSYSSRQAIDLFNEDPSIALVVCDLLMPGFDGIELIQRLKQYSKKHRVFDAVLLSAQGDKKDLVRALREGFSDYHQKPVNPDSLLQTLKKLEEKQTDSAAHNQSTEALGRRLQGLINSIIDIHSDIKKAHPPRARNTSSPSDTEQTDYKEFLFSKLSPRQLQAAQLVSEGKTNYEIASDMGITPNTVKLYISQILNLTGASNRTQLALALKSHGLSL